MKLSTQQSTALRLIAQGHKEHGIEERIPWYPRSQCHLESRQLAFDAAQIGPAIKALCRKGLVEMVPRLHRYAAVVTDLGIRVAEAEAGKAICFVAPWDQQVIREKREAAEARGEDY